MNSNLMMSFLGLVYIILLALVFFNQKSLKKFENDIYGVLIICILFQLILGIISYYSILYKDNYPIFNFITNKFYLITLWGWIMIFTMYVISISLNLSDPSKLYKYKSIYFIIAALNTIITFCLPISYVIEGKTMYSTGYATYFTYISAIISICAILITIIINFKKMKNKKYLPTLLFIGLGTFFMFLQMKIPNLFLVSPLEAFITFLMYFTIENPDVNIIEELSKSRLTAEQSVDEKQQFIYLVTNQVRDVMDQVDNLCQDSLNQESKEMINNNMLSIRGLIKNSKIRINEMLNVSDTDASNLKITKSKYNIKLLIEEIKIQTKSKVNESIDFRVNIGDNIPEEVYGDSLKLKQIISTLLDNSIKYTKSGFIELRVACLIKYDICRLIITVEDSGVGMDSITINDILKDNGDLTEKDIEVNDQLNLNLKIVQKIINLSGGVMTIDSVPNKGTSIKIVIDQKEVLEENNQLQKYSNELLSKKNVAIVVNDAMMLKDIKRTLNNIDLNIEYFDESIKCLNNIRNRVNYDLIIIEENMPKIPAYSLYQKIKMNKTFKGKIVIISLSKDLKYRKSLLNEGFDDVINYPFNKKELRLRIEKLKS